MALTRGDDVLWLAQKYDDYLDRSGGTDLEPWEQQIREFARSGKAAGIGAEQKLREWGKKEGHITAL